MKHSHTQSTSPLLTQEAVRQKGSDVLISITVHTNAQHNTLRPFRDDSYKLEITASPQKGKANHAILHFLAEYFHKKLSDISIAHGHTSKKKQILIRNCSLPEIQALLR